MITVTANNIPITILFNDDNSYKGSNPSYHMSYLLHVGTAPGGCQTSFGSCQTSFERCKTCPISPYQTNRRCVDNLISLLPELRRKYPELFL